MLSTTRQPARSLGRVIRRDFIRNRALYLLVLPVVVFYVLFCYVPMFGVMIAFKDYSRSRGFLPAPGPVRAG